jgi:adenylate cyclase
LGHQPNLKVCATAVIFVILSAVRKLLAGLAIGVGAALVVLLLAWPGWLDTAELKSYDWRMRMASRIRQARNQPLVHPDIVLVEINDATIRDLTDIAGRWPWPRALSALLVDFLHRGGPKVIAFDIGFWEPEREATYPFLGEEWTSARSDGALAEAVRRAGNVILLANAVDPGLVDGEVAQKPWQAPAYRLGPAIEARPVITLPYDTLAAAAAGFGHNFLALDPDGPARRMPPFVRKDARYMPSLGMAVALAAGGYRPDEVVLDGNSIRVRDRRIPLVRIDVASVVDPSNRHDQQTMLINYRAPAHVAGVRSYPSYEARDLLRSEGQIQDGTTPDVDPLHFKDKIVFIGLTASGLADAFQTPFGKGTFPGIQLHASVADGVLSDLFITPAPTWSRVAATLGGAVLVGLMSAALPFAAASAGALALAASWTGASLVAFGGGLWLAMVQPILAIGAALFAGTAYRYFVEDAEKRKVSRLFGRYVSRDVHKQLLANPALAELGGSRREMSVLFSDLRGFTTITEKGAPEAIVHQLNEYFSRMVDIVFRHGGTVDKFVGDMVMALFGAPLDDVDHADAAVATAVDMVRELGELNRRWAAEGRIQLDIGIGVNSGDMIAGNIGSSAIMSYTVIGDNVNVGSRLESLNKEYRTRIIISDATRTRLRKPYDLRPLGGVVVKGKTQPVEIFELSVPSPLTAVETGKPAGVEERTV